MNCIRCSTPTVTRQYEGVEVDQCPKCKGIWLDEGELERIIDIEEEKFSPELIQAAIKKGFAGIPQDEQQSVELCPKCNARMTAVNYSYHTGVIIDRCPNHHGVWFDREELEKIQANKEHWSHEINANKATYVKNMRAVEAESNAEIASVRKDAGKVPSNFLINRVIGAVMRVFDRD